MKKGLGALLCPVVVLDTKNTTVVKDICGFHLIELAASKGRHINHTYLRNTCRITTLISFMETKVQS